MLLSNTSHELPHFQQSQWPAAAGQHVSQLLPTLSMMLCSKLLVRYKSVELTMATASAEKALEVLAMPPDELPVRLLLLPASDVQVKERGQHGVKSYVELLQM